MLKISSHYSNNYFHLGLLSAGLLSTLLAKRAITILPTTSNGGLLLNGAFQAGWFFFFGKAVGKAESHLDYTIKTFLSIGLACFTAPLAASLLKGRVSLSWGDSLKFTAIQRLFLGGAFYKAKEEIIYKHDFYSKNLLEWYKLSGKERIHCNKEFNDAHLDRINSSVDHLSALSNGGPAVGQFLDSLSLDQLFNFTQEDFKFIAEQESVKDLGDLKKFLLNSAMNAYHPTYEIDFQFNSGFLTYPKFLSDFYCSLVLNYLIKFNDKLTISPALKEELKRHIEERSKQRQG